MTLSVTLKNGTINALDKYTNKKKLSSRSNAFMRIFKTLKSKPELVIDLKLNPTGFNNEQKDEQFLTRAIHFTSSVELNDWLKLISTTQNYHSVSAFVNDVLEAVFKNRCELAKLVTRDLNNERKRNERRNAQIL